MRRHLIKDATGSAPSPSSVPLAVNARIDRLIIGPQRELRQVTAELLRTRRHLAIGADRRPLTERPSAVAAVRRGGGRAGFIFQSDDLGATLKLLDIADNVVGGRLTIDGQLSETAGKRTLRAHIEGRELYDRAGARSWPASWRCRP